MQICYFSLYASMALQSENSSFLHPEGFIKQKVDTLDNLGINHTETQGIVSTRKHTHAHTLHVKQLGSM